MKTGRYNIAQLLTSPEVEQIVIPELQRDYVWGGRNVKGLLTSILDNFNSMVKQTLLFKDSQGNNIDRDIMDYLNEEYMRLRYNTRVGFIYAYHDRALSGQYYLIDGQQRITTIFLVLLALYRRFNVEQFRKMYFTANIPKVDYKVRDVAHSFLVDFIEFELSKADANETFKDSNRYYSEYDKDITAQSIYKNYYNVIVPQIGSYLNVESLINYVENYIEFNYFDTNMSEQGEKLYLYMNSRGESLSTQEHIKTVIIGRCKDKLQAGKMWEDWQNFFWRIKPQSDNNSDRGYFVFLKWAVIIHMCRHQDAKIKKSENREKPKNRIEEIEDYIRVEKKDKDIIIQQNDWICTYISENENFTFEWLQKVEIAVEHLYCLLQTQEFNDGDFNVNPWFTGEADTIDYCILLGILNYLVSFGNKTENDINVLRLAMYLKNLKFEYTLRRNPDRAVIRCVNLTNWMFRKGIKDTRLLGKYAIHDKDDEKYSDKYVLRNDDLRWGYYQLDWQESQSIYKHVDKIGKWESFFWKIINHAELNRFLRGNHDFIIKLLNKTCLSPDVLLSLFINKIYDHRANDGLRKSLLVYGDISIDDNGGGSSNIGPNWMERWCLLGTNSDETYWNNFMNGTKSDISASIVANYIVGNNLCTIQDTILKELGNNISYMNQKYYLWDEKKHLRIILLQDKQASKSKARELCIQYLHKQIHDSWVWEHNFCVTNFIPAENGLVTNISDKNKGYYIDLWYDWSNTSGFWYCRLGHRNQDLSPIVIENIKERGNTIKGQECQWIEENGTHKSLRIINPIYTEKEKDDYFNGASWVKSFYDELWRVLEQMYNDNLFS